MSASDAAPPARPSAHVSGSWYAPRTSTRHDATLALDGARYRLDAPGAAFAAEGDAGELEISDRLGSTPRRVRLPDGAEFETPHNGAIDAWLGRGRHRAGRALALHRLESRWTMVAAGVLVTVAVVFSTFRWGVPAASVAVADRMPVRAHVLLGDGTLEAMDSLVLGDSELDGARRDRIERRFEALVAGIDTGGFEPSLHFRKLGGVPNAFALPGGEIVLTDALVELAGAPEEIDAVLLHEIGHVVERHGMRRAIQASAVTLIVTLALGDSSGVAELATGLPVLLAQASYSRRDEAEADGFAFARMLETGRDPAHFAAIMRRLRAFDGRADDPSAADWFSSHPDAEARARRAEALSTGR